MIEDFRKKKIVGMQPAFDLVSSAYDQIDRNAWVESTEDFGGFLRPRASTPENDQDVQVGIRSSISIRVGTEQDDPLRLEFRGDAIPQVQDALFVDHFFLLSLRDYTLGDQRLKSISSGGGIAICTLPARSETIL
jgi:hypothetical protein